MKAECEHGLDTRLPCSDCQKAYDAENAPSLDTVESLVGCAQPHHTCRHCYGELVLMVDVFAACIETGVMPSHGSPCHRNARLLVDKSGIKPKRKRRRLPPNDQADAPEKAQEETV